MAERARGAGLVLAPWGLGHGPARLRSKTHSAGQHPRSSPPGLRSSFSAPSHPRGPAPPGRLRLGMAERVRGAGHVLAPWRVAHGPARLRSKTHSAGRHPWSSPPGPRSSFSACSPTTAPGRVALGSVDHVLEYRLEAMPPRDVSIIMRPRVGPRSRRRSLRGSRTDHESNLERCATPMWRPPAPACSTRRAYH